MQITQNIHAVKIPFQIPVAPDRVLDRYAYTYVVTGNKSCLIDAAVAGADQIIFDYLNRIGKKPETLETVLLTHSHPDHIGAAKTIRDAIHCKVTAHSLARPWVEDTEKQFAERPVPGFHNLVAGSVPVDHVVEDNDVLACGDVRLQVLHTPGHSRCSISLWCEEEGVLFSGDAIPPMNDLPIYEDVGQLAASLERLRKITGIKHLLSSWHDPKTGGAIADAFAAGSNYVQKIHTAIRQVVKSNNGIGAMELCREIVEMLHLPEFAVNPLVAGSFTSHLPHLDKERLV